MDIFSSLDNRINRLGFWSVFVVIVTAIISLYLPLDAPNGYAVEHADRVAWLSNNRELFIAGWVNQIVAMLSLSGAFFAIAWRVGSTSPLIAMIAAMVVLCPLWRLLSLSSLLYGPFPFSPTPFQPPHQAPSWPIISVSICGASDALVGGE